MAYMMIYLKHVFNVNNTTMCLVSQVTYGGSGHMVGHVQEMSFYSFGRYSVVFMCDIFLLVVGEYQIQLVVF